MTRNRMSSLRVVLAIAAMLVALAGPASATFPGKNGRIAFVEGPDVFTMNPDGSNVRQLTFLGPDNAAFWQSWSADGQQIVFSEFLAPDFIPQLWVMNADGSDQHLLFSDPGFADHAPNFAPDGSKVAFTRCQLFEHGTCAIYRVGADGTDLTALTQFQPEVRDFAPAYSPDGTTIAFDSFNRDGVLGAIYLMNANGSRIRPLTPPELGARQPDWSPDGEKIAFSTHCCNPQNEEIWVIGADGRGLKQLTRNNNEDWQGPDSAPHDWMPSWSPRGNAIVFVRFSPSFDSSAILVMNRDGGSQRLLHEGLERRAVKLPLSSGEAARKRGIRHHLEQIEEGGQLPRWGAASN
jgi:Tol biopolymer transport system component